MNATDGLRHEGWRQMIRDTPDVSRRVHPGGPVRAGAGLQPVFNLTSRERGGNVQSILFGLNFIGADSSE